MMSDESIAKNRIFQAAFELVTEGKSDQQITTRQISSRAGVNLALINYYYQSKENLLNQVVGVMMDKIVKESIQSDNINASAETRLREMLLTTAAAAFRYRNICKIALTKELKTGCINSCCLVTPLLREILVERSVVELEVLAMQLMIPFHHIVINPEIYNKHLDTDFFDEEKRNQKINEMIDCVLCGRIREVE
jgi:TetR/AcrR family transcriptional regulator, regulator of cefoperazone and chloramphenicol sensitivity